MSAPAILLAVPFASIPEAQNAMAELEHLVARAQEDAEALQLDIRDCAIVLRNAQSRIELEQSRQIAAGEGLVAGGTVGLIAGLLLGGPIAGALLGLAGGAAFGSRDTGIPDARMRQLGEELVPGRAILCVLADAGAVANARQGLSRYGEVLELEVSSDAAP